MSLATTSDIERLVTAPNKQDLIDRAEAIVRAYCHRHLSRRTGIVETHDGGKRLLRLVEYPVEPDTVTITVDDDPVDSDGIVVYPDGRIYQHRAAGQPAPRWPDGQRNITVTYTGGYDPVPHDIIDVVSSIATRLYQAGHAAEVAPDAATAVKRVTLAGSDTVEYRDTVGDVTTAQRLTADEMLTLDFHRRPIIV